jgi:ribosomal protein L11 methyltransferase
MNQYIQIEFTEITVEQSEILIAQLGDINFEGFEENEKSLKAFIQLKDYDELSLTLIANTQKLTFSKTVIEETNWNRIWESNFNPVIVDDFVGIRAGFHQPIEHVQHEIIITPKMSFGTGHHATTCLMIQQMREIDFSDQTVFDFGTGTGILAILAEKLGAKKIVAADNDEWSIKNAGENIHDNRCSLIELIKTDTADMNDSFDIILANINKNVIMDNFSALIKQLSSDGILLISGLLKEDEDDIFRKSSAYSLQLVHTSTRDNWLCLKFSR